MKWHEGLNLALAFLGGICLPLYIAIFLQPKLEEVRSDQDEIAAIQREQLRTSALRVVTSFGPKDQTLYVQVINYGHENSDPITISIKPNLDSVKLPSARSLSERDQHPFNATVAANGSLVVQFQQGIGPSNGILLQLSDIKTPRGSSLQSAFSVAVFSKGTLIYPPAAGHFAGGGGFSSGGGGGKW